MMKKIITLISLALVMNAACSQKNDSGQNPFFAPFDTPYNTIPFDKIKLEHYKPAVIRGIEQAKAEVEAIAGSAENPDFINTIDALERAAELLSTVSSVFFNLNSAETSDSMQMLAEELSPMLTEYANDVMLNEKLFKRIDQVYHNRANENLTPEQTIVLENTWKSFTRNGANLSDADKEKLRAIDMELSTLSLKFQKNVLSDTNDYLLTITDQTQVDGLPPFAKEAAGEESKSRSLEGWTFTLQAPSYIPFMTYVKDRSLRKKLAAEYGKRGNRGGETDNKAAIARIVELRDERARLLGYPTHADFVLEENMAKTAARVDEFLADLLQKAMPAARRDVETLKKYALEKDGVKDFASYDHPYYAERLKEEKYTLDQEKLKPYFELNNVINGAFEVANRLYGLTFEQVNDIPKYHPDVKTYLVKDSTGMLKAIFYGDYFPREGKRSGAWMSNIVDQRIVEGGDIRPHVMNVCNFTKPTADAPSLLTFDEVETLFHEFGHALHGMLSDVTYSSISGTNTPVDFVELPSQLMENWCYEPEALKLFAKHYQSGQVIPDSLIEALKKSSNYMEGYATVRQLSFGMLDMAYHYKSADFLNATHKDVKAYEKQALTSTQLYPPLDSTSVSTAFAHIFAGGYSAGYYSYKWSEVLDADAFGKFKREGILNRKTGTQFERTVLSKGASKPAEELYEDFMGRPADPSALLERAGLLN